MKSEIKTVTIRDKKSTYPCLMTNPHSGLVLLMSKYGCGTVLLIGSEPETLGRYGECWDMNLLKLLPAGSNVILTV